MHPLEALNLVNNNKKLVLQFLKKTGTNFVPVGRWKSTLQIKCRKTAFNIQITTAVALPAYNHKLVLFALNIGYCRRLI